MITLLSFLLEYCEVWDESTMSHAVLLKNSRPCTSKCRNVQAWMRDHGLCHQDSRYRVTKAWIVMIILVFGSGFPSIYQSSQKCNDKGNWNWQSFSKRNELTMFPLALSCVIFKSWWMSSVRNYFEWNRHEVRVRRFQDWVSRLFDHSLLPW